jgi:glycosyltransferase involved in cell wall biosynthesis
VTLVRRMRTIVGGVVRRGAGKLPSPPREPAPYALAERLRAVVSTAVPPGSVVAVVSRGDDRLLRLDIGSGWHFPQTEHGVYAGHHPENSSEAIDHLEALRTRGATHLVIPCTSFWWLEHYADFTVHLTQRYHLIAFLDDTCVVFSLTERPSEVIYALPIYLEPKARGLRAATNLAPPTTVEDQPAPSTATNTADTAAGPRAGPVPPSKDPTPATLREAGATNSRVGPPLEDERALRDDVLLYHLLGPRSHRPHPRVLLYGNVNTNAIDGSSVWLVNVARMLSLRYEVDVLLKARVTTDYLLSELKGLPNVNLITPDVYPLHMSRFGDSYYLTDYSASELIAKLDMENVYTFVLSRGREVSYYLSLNPLISKKLVAYFLMDYHVSSDRATNLELAMLQTIVWNARVVLAQTKMLKDFMCDVFDCEDDKILLLPPIVSHTSVDEDIISNKAMMCLYAGKFDLDWRIDDILRVFRQTDRPLQLVGNKFHDQQVNGEPLKKFVLRMADGEVIRYLGAVDHRDIYHLIDQSDYSISIRTEKYLLSKEFSTKVLEFGLRGKPTIVNDSAINREILGEDYPLFANTNDELADALSRIGDPEVYRHAALACLNAARRSSVRTVALVCDEIEERLRSGDGEGRRVVVVSDDWDHVSAIRRQTDAKDNPRVMTVLCPAIDGLRYDPLVRLVRWADDANAHFRGQADQRLIDVLNAAEYPIVWSCAGEVDLPHAAAAGRAVSSGRSQREACAPDMSVIIPCWNTAPSLVERALESVINQESLDGMECEVVVVDDASAIPISQAIDPRYQDHPSIRFVRNPANKGLGLSRNIGYERARGSSVAFLDADDYLGPTFVRDLGTCLENCDVAIGKMVIHWEDRGQFDDQTYVNEAREALVGPAPDLPRLVTVASACVKAYRREAVEAGRLHFHFGFHEDIYPWVRFLLHHKECRLGYVESAIYYRTIREGSNQITLDSSLEMARIRDLNNARRMVVDLLSSHNTGSEYDSVIARYDRLIENDLKKLLAGPEPKRLRSLLARVAARV